MSGRTRRAADRLAPDRLGGRALATAAGIVASRWIPTLSDEVHPVARFGRTMTSLEGVVHRDDRRAGVLYAVAGVGLGFLTARSARSTAAVVAVCAAGGQLRSVASGVARDLRDAGGTGDLEAARRALPALVGRDPSTLDDRGIAAAAIESVAENMVDAVFAPAFWGLVAGGPGAGVHRALNTMDAMVGHHDERYEHFGWAAARADDVAAWVPARLFALAVAAARPDRAGAIRDTVRRDAPAHPSPNAGVAEAAMAAALGRELGGPLRYGDVAEERPELGEGPRPDVDDLDEAIAVATRAEDLLVAALVAVALASFLRGLGTSRGPRR